MKVNGKNFPTHDLELGVVAFSLKIRSHHHMMFMQMYSLITITQGLLYTHFYNTVKAIVFTGAFRILSMRSTTHVEEEKIYQKMCIECTFKIPTDGFQRRKSSGDEWS